MPLILEDLFSSRHKSLSSSSSLSLLKTPRSVDSRALPEDCGELDKPEELEDPPPCSLFSFRAREEAFSGTLWRISGGPLEPPVGVP